MLQLVKGNVIMVKLIAADNKDMANGQRDTSRTLLSNKEIAFVKSEIQRIGADESVFVFNDPGHITKSTCYGIIEDKIYITRNVFPDEKYGSTHPRDLMSVGAVLAHEYYGHRTYRNEYLSDIANDTETTPYWQDECRASITAAKLAPNLTERDKSNLIMDAIYRAKEEGHLIEMDDFMKEVVYGYSNGEKSIARNITPINYVSEKSNERTEPTWSNDGQMSKVRKFTRDNDDFKR
jgi:hypothetical protein